CFSLYSILWHHSVTCFTAVSITMALASSSRRLAPHWHNGRIIASPLLMPCRPLRMSYRHWHKTVKPATWRRLSTATLWAPPVPLIVPRAVYGQQPCPAAHNKPKTFWRKPPHSG